jgi:SAM-dependent methyltransferase
LLPFDDNTFDSVVAVSCLEYIDELDTAAQEIKRVMRKDGCFVFATPGDSPVIDRGVKLLTGRSTREHYGDRRSALIPTLIKSFVVQQELAVPQVGGGLITFYRGMRLGLS